MPIKNRLLSIAVLIAFLLNVAMPFFAVYQVPQTPQIGKLASVFGEKILICSGEGFKWVKLADLQSGKETPRPHANIKCPLCFIARHAQDMALLPVASLDLPPYSHGPTVAYDVTPLTSRFTARLRARAPPSFTA